MRKERDALDQLISKGFRDLEHMAQEYPRLKAVEEAAREAVAKLTDKSCEWYSSAVEFNQNDGHERHKSLEALRAALERK